MTEEPPPFEVEITDVIDLHTFRPAEMKDVAKSYLDAAYEAGHRSLRIIHGRGAGVQRKAVRSLLRGDRRVRSFRDADPGDGGRGATLVEFE